MHQARVISLSPFDQVLSVSLQPSVLKQAFIRYNDLKPGMPVKATVTRLVNNGILLSVSDNINGFVPKLHMSDVTLSNPGKMFKAGTTMVKGHVLSCDPSQRRLIITLRKTLVNSTLAKITSYEEAKPGLLSSGVITSVTDFGCFVAFYNGVKGFAHISELSDEFITKPSQHFKVGQTVKIRVVSGVEDGNKLKISFKLNIGSTSATTAHHLTHSIALGHLVSAKLMSKSASSFVLELSNGQSSEDPSSSTLTATMDVAHLSDVKDPAHLTKLVASAFKEGQVIHDCLVIGIDMKRKAVRLSIKPCLVAMAKEGRLVTSMDAVQVGMVVPGFVQKLLPSGCIVGLVGGMFGLAKLHTISDRFITAIGDHISEGQTVLATVTEIDDVTRRFTVNLKNSVNFPSELGVAPSRYEAAYLESMFGELDAVFLHNNVSINTANLWCAGLCIGSLVEGSVKQVLPYGYIIDVNGKHSSGISGLVTTYQGVGKGLVEGSSVKARIMDIDLQKKIIDLSLSHTEVVEVNLGLGNFNMTAQVLDSNSSDSTSHF